MSTKPINDTNTNRANTFAIFALVISTVALLLAITPSIFNTVTPQPNYTPEASISKLVYIAKEVKANIKSNKKYYNLSDTKSYQLDSIALYGSLSLAILGALFSVFSYIRNENKRYYIGAFTISAITLFWSFMWIAIACVIGFIILQFVGDI